MMLSPNITLIIKVTNACDMKCRYCFIEPSVFHKTMKPETAVRVVHAFLDSGFFESVHFVWHGGEPRLRGRRFFEPIFEEQRACTTTEAYANSTQTNATHLDDDMLAFLLANDVGHRPQPRRAGVADRRVQEVAPSAADAQPHTARRRPQAHGRARNDRRRASG